MPSQKPYALPRRARPYQEKRAGLVSRGIAAVIDAVIVALLLCLGYVGLVGLRFLISPRDFSFPDTRLILSLAAAATVCVTYLTVCWWLGGRTYGDLVMGLRVVNFRNEGMRLAGAFSRALLCTLFPIGLLWAAVSRENRSVQDLVLRTSVIYDWQPRAGRGHTSPHH